MFGQIGNDGAEGVFMEMKGVGKAKEISHGISTAIINEDGSLWMAGNNVAGQLGRGGTARKCSSFRQPTGIDKVKTVATRHTHAALIKEDGSLWMCGDNEYGQLGHGSKDNYTDHFIRIVVGDETVVDPVDPDAPVDSDDPITTEGIVNLTMRTDASSGGADGNTTHEFYYNDEYFYTENTKYNNALAIMSLGLELSAFSIPQLDKYFSLHLSDNDRAANIKDAYDQLGFSDSEYFNYDISLASEADKVAYSFARKEITDGKSEDTLIAVVMRGGGYGEEWVSNFNLGLEGDHEGFSKSAKEVYVRLDQYMNELRKDHKIKGDIKLWVMGYSRGGAVANILSHYINEHRLVKYNNLYAYTFATPSGYYKTAENNVDDNNIHNICSANDFVPKLALKRWGFSKYGQTHVLPNYTTAGVKKYWEWITWEPLPVNSEYNVQTALFNVLADYFPTRESFVNNIQEYVQFGVSLSLGGGISDKSYAEMKFLQIIQTILKTMVKNNLKEQLNEQSKENQIDDFITILRSFKAAFHAGQNLGYALQGEELTKQVHYPEHYLSWLETGGLSIEPNGYYCRRTEETQNLINRQVNTIFNSTYKRYDFFCPVDVYFYDQDNKVVAQIINNVIDEENTTIPCEVVGDHKIVYAPENDYTIKVVGNDLGKMDYKVTEYDCSKEEIRNVCFYELPIDKNTTYTGKGSKKTLNQTETYELRDNTGKVIEPSYDSMSSKGNSYNIQVENGISLSSDAVPGEMISIMTFDDEEYEFDHWETDSKDIYIEDIHNSSTHFKMAGHDVKMKAVIKSKNTGLYTDSTCSELAGIEDRTSYINGSSKKVNGTKINYKQKLLYTNLQPSNIVTLDSNGKEKVKKGKLIVGITSTDVTPSAVNGKIIDKEAGKIAKARISKNRIIVTPQKETGEVYLWVIDTGDEGKIVHANIVVKAAPSKITTYSVARESNNSEPPKDKIYRKAAITVGETTAVYIDPIWVCNKMKQPVKDATYSITKSKGFDDYFSVSDIGFDNSFYITSKKLKNNKKTKGKVTVRCDQNGKTVSFTITAVNEVKNITLDHAENVILKKGSNEQDIDTILITTSQRAAIKGSVGFNVSCVSDSVTDQITDVPKIYLMGSESGYDQNRFDAGKSIKITSKPSSLQKKISVKFSKDKKTLNITVAKKLQPGVEVYALIVYNRKSEEVGTGYKVIKVKTVEE